jgi:hypothetical protein
MSIHIRGSVRAGHPNGQRITAGVRFTTAPADTYVTAEQLAIIQADDSIVCAVLIGAATEPPPIATPPPARKSRKRRK